MMHPRMLSCFFPRFSPRKPHMHRILTQHCQPFTHNSFRIINHSHTRQQYHQGSLSRGVADLQLPPHVRLPVLQRRLIPENGGETWVLLLENDKRRNSNINSN